jgi:calcineurin-like phosphoesterase family protein
MSEIYLVSDPHWGHGEIIKYEKRPFTSVEEMDETIMNNIQNTIKKRDRLIFLGDVALHYPQERLAKFLARISCSKTLILGNHDRCHSVKWWFDVGFDEVSRYPILVDYFFILSHEPKYVGPESPYANIHGHTHSTSMDNPYMKNVCVEKTDYKPILLAQAEEEIRQKVSTAGLKNLERKTYEH